MQKLDGVNYSVQNGIALLGCNNGPVNALGLPLRKGLKAGLAKAVGDSNVDAIVVYGEGRTFPAGADISEFATGTVGMVRLDKILNNFEDAPKPIVAAMHGTALGGGCELSLACHYRIGTGKSKYGFPEVNLGLLPGGGGTQRAPRIVGPLVALEMISTGKPMKSYDAEQAGLLDAVVDVPKGQDELTYLKQKAVDFARSIAKTPFEDRRTRYKKCEKMDDFYYDNALQMTRKMARGHVAPAKCIEAVRGATMLPIEQGLKLESKLFFQLLQTPESRALQHVFFSQRAVTKLPGIPLSMAQPVKSVAIIGAGTMGAGIAMCFAQKGIKVVMKDIKKEYLDRGMKIIGGNWKRSAKKGKWTRAQIKKMTSLIKPTLDYSDCKDVDLVIEAVFENMKLKKDIMGTLDKVCKPSCILATNTSTLDVDEIANATSRPEKVIGMHFFSPANVMMLLENVKGAKTSKSTIATATAVGKKIGKIPVLVGNCFGFVGNRVMFPYSAEAERLVEEGASPYDVDKTIYKFGMAMGPFQVSDLSGIDVGYKIRKQQMLLNGLTEKPAFYPMDISDALYNAKELGQKTKMGWYNYKKSRRGKPREDLMAVIEKIRAQKGLGGRSFSPKEIEERCLFALVNEAFKTLDDGIAQRPMDVDVIWMFGYGFPVTKGGPCFYADQVGAKHIVSKIKEFQRNCPENESWKISPLLQKCADQNIGVHKLYKKMAKKRSKL